MASPAAPAVIDLHGPFGTRRIIDLTAAAGGAAVLARMPWCHRVLLENVLRQRDRAAAGRAALVGWLANARSEAELAFAPLRILMHDTTCGPALVDIAAMRDALAAAGGDPEKLNPTVPVATSIDHSVALDRSGTPEALAFNMTREMERNAERYRFMKWAGTALRGFQVFPPGSGIMHTINMERLATVVTTQMRDGVTWAAPDTLVGTDSHTPTVNGIGVLGWGVGGLEAEGAMFGVPIELRVPDVCGVRLTGALPQGVLATDLALVVTERLRKAGVAGEFVEFFGAGVTTLSATERAVVANMAPEYGASTGCFAIDARTLAYLRDTGRAEADVALVEAYARANGLWHHDDAHPRYTHEIEIDLSALRICLAGPHRPQDRLDPASLTAALQPLPSAARAGGIPPDAIAIAAITSCTNTTDTGLLVTAGLLAKHARARGLAPPPWVKTSLAPGSPAARARLARAGVLADLEALGFGIAAYGCTTCIGNAGPLLPVMTDAIEHEDVKPVAVLSGNRNFPGRVHVQVDAALLASPPIVVAYALAGRACIDVTSDPLGLDGDGQPVHLADLWPARDEVERALAAATDPTDVAVATAQPNTRWFALDAPGGARFAWDPASTYLRPPPFVRLAPVRTVAPAGVNTLDAHPLLVLADDITTDHISPAGAIAPHGDAGAWLVEHGEDARDLNVYAARRGNWEVMLRGLFTNRAVVNHLCPGAAPGHTVFAPSGETMPLWRAARRYAEIAAPVVILAGERYGAGSSRDWAAKGVQLLGTVAVLATSFERIHRANLIGMGVLPLQLPAGWHATKMGIVCGDTLQIDLDPAALHPRARVAIRLRRGASGETIAGQAVALLDTGRDVALIRSGGMIPMILRAALDDDPAAR